MLTVMATEHFYAEEISGSTCSYVIRPIEEVDGNATMAYLSFMETDEGKALAVKVHANLLLIGVGTEETLLILKSLERLLLTWQGEKSAECAIMSEQPDFSKEITHAPRPAKDSRRDN